MSGVTEDRWIETVRGGLFARLWTPDHRALASRAAVMLLHDSLGSVELWRDFPARLAEATGRAVVAYDRLGFGRSDPAPGPAPRDFIEAEGRDNILVLRATLGLSRLAMFGHSVGGGMAVATAARWPDLCVGVVTESAQAFVEDVTLAGIRAAEVAFQAPDQMARLTRYHGDKAPWVLDAWVGTWTSAAFADWSLDEALRRVTCPLLALHGDRDEYGSPRHPERIARLAGGRSERLLLQDTGHVPHRERPDEVLGAVARFLAPLA
jgi:pimeloyl-ACP methyl ester carboxylesterase